MRKLTVFNSVTVDGYFTGENGDLSWAHADDPEWEKFVEENAQGGGELIFGRVTYDMMKNFWPTPEAKKLFPAVADRMNSMTKIVFSRTLKEAQWSNTRLLSSDPTEELRRLKQEAGDDMTILGSGTIVAQLAQSGVIDEYDLVVYPVVIGKGRTMFEGVKDKVDLRLMKTRSFKNGNVLESYEPVNRRRP